MTAHDLTTKGKPVTTPITTTLRALTADTETLLAARLRPLGITVPQLEFLTVYATQPDSCGADAARACHVTPQTGTSVLRGLTNRGLIKAKRIPGNGRRHVITVTPAGHKTLADARTATRDIEERLSALLGTEAAFRMQDATKVLETQVAGGRPKYTPTAKTRGGGKAKASPKATRAPKKTPPAPAELHARALAWSADHDSPGRIPAASATRLGTPTQIRQLLADGTWRTDGDHYLTSPA